MSEITISKIVTANRIRGVILENVSIPADQAVNVRIKVLSTGAVSTYVTFTKTIRGKTIVPVPAGSAGAESGSMVAIRAEPMDIEAWFESDESTSLEVRR